MPSPNGAGLPGRRPSPLVQPVPLIRLPPQGPSNKWSSVADYVQHLAKSSGGQRLALPEGGLRGALQSVRAEHPGPEPINTVGTPDRPPYEDEDLLSLSGSETVASDEYAQPKNPSPEPTADTAHSLAEPDDTPSGRTASPRHRAAVQASAAPTLAELHGIQGELKSLLSRAVTTDQRLLQDVRVTSRQAGRREALDEVYRSLRDRSVSKRLGTAERNILKREADAVYQLAGSGTGDGQGQVRMENAPKGQERVLEALLETVDLLCGRASAAVDPSAAGVGAARTKVRKPGV